MAICCTTPSRLTAIRGPIVMVSTRSRVRHATACHLQLAAATPEIGYAIDSMHEMPADDIVAGGPLPVRDGAFAVPQGSGLGVTVDQDKVRFYAERYVEEDPTG